MPNEHEPPFDPGDANDAVELAELRGLALAEPGSPIDWERPPATLRASVLHAAAEGAHTPHDTPAPTADLTRHREQRRDHRSEAQRGRRIRWELAAAALVVIALAVGVLMSRDRVNEQLVASVDLDTLLGNGTGSAELVNVDGSMQLRLDTAGLESEDGYLELWVLDESTTKLVSLGPLRPDGRYDVPDSVDMTKFPIVDISVEPLDGDPTHSGKSLLRGQLAI